MKRNVDLSRAILLAAEAADGSISNEGLAEEPGFEAYDPQTIGGHMLLLRDAALAVMIDHGHVDDEEGVTVSMSRITDQGHDFIERARDEARWSKAKGALKAAGIAVTLHALKTVLGEQAEEAVRELFKR